MASPGNRHCANGIGTLSFPVASNEVSLTRPRWRQMRSGRVEVRHRCRRSNTSSSRAVAPACSSTRQQYTQKRIRATLKKGKGSPYSITERRVLELIPVLGS